MKTKNAILSALVAMFVSVTAFANESVNSKLVVLDQKSGVFKVIYEGSGAGKVSMKIIDNTGNRLFSEPIKSNNGFSRPVNFDGMAPGVYTIEITDANGTLIEKVNYKSETIAKNVYISKTADEGKYLLAVTDESTREISVRIFDGESNLVHDGKVTVRGNFGIVYNLRKVAGTPTFEVTDANGNDLIIK